MISHNCKVHINPVLQIRKITLRELKCLDLVEPGFESKSQLKDHGLSWVLSSIPKSIHFLWSPISSHIAMLIVFSSGSTSRV